MMDMAEGRTWLIPEVASVSKTYASIPDVRVTLMVMILISQVVVGIWNIKPFKSFFCSYNQSKHSFHALFGIEDRKVHLIKTLIYGRNPVHEHKVVKLTEAQRARLIITYL